MMNKIPFISLIVAFATIAICASTPLFLEREIASALDSRDEYYAKKEVSSFLQPAFDKLRLPPLKWRILISMQ